MAVCRMGKVDAIARAYLNMVSKLYPFVQGMLIVACCEVNRCLEANSGNIEEAISRVVNIDGGGWKCKKAFQVVS
eukprot:7426395-Ditylum_brightwellii.AAC.1